MSELLSAFAYVAHPLPFLLLLIGIFSGIVVGAMPGLTGAMLITLSLPLTYFMEPKNAVIMLVSMYVGSISGSLITATLLRIPGTPASIMTTFDGYPMAQQGRPGRALGLGISASFFGGLVSWVALVTLSKPLSVIGARFGPWEIFALVMVALVLIASISKGSMVKGLMAGLLGVLLSMPGVDPAVGAPRLTFGFDRMNNGFQLLPVLIGVFAMSQVIRDILDLDKKSEAITPSRAGIWLTLADWRKHGWNMLRSSIIGTWIGILPGVGASVGSIVAYTSAKNLSKTPEAFGTGSEEGIVASEAANNATIGGALIPLIALGIPGSVIDAILIAALLLHSIQPGPLLFINNSDIVYAIIATALVANFFMFLVMGFSAGLMSRLMYLPRLYLAPIVLVLSVLGTFAVNNVIFDVWVMLAFGLVGYLMDRAGMPLGAFVIGFVLAPLGEEKLRTGLMISGGSFAPMYERPMTLILLVVAGLTLIWPLLSAWRNRSRQRTLR